ncbi:MAG: hypothetical protein AABY52_07135 [Deltaproteobacteria bacterium]
MTRRLICFAVSVVFIMAGMFTGIAAAEEEPSHGDNTKKTQDKHGGHDVAQAGVMLMVSTEPSDIKPGQPVKLHLIIHDATGAMVKDFETVHEKKLHLIIVRDGLDQFAHIHPKIDRAKNITETFTFPTAGKYRLYADYKPRGKKQTTAIAEVNVAGMPPPSPQLVPNTPGRVRGDGLVADIAMEKTKSEGTTRISFALFDAAGKPVADLQPYLGAMGHLIVISGDGKRYVHSHHVEGKTPGGAVTFEAYFPHPGIYKGWGQFRRSDMVHDVPFVVKIE